MKGREVAAPPYNSPLPCIMAKSVLGGFIKGVVSHDSSVG